MKKHPVRKTVDLIAGEKAGRIIFASWNWVWGKPIESGGKLSLEVAKDALATMEKKVINLTEAVAKVTASYQQARKIYETKQQEAYDAENKSKLAYERGNLEGARLAMTQVIATEKILPQLSQMVETAEERMNAAKEQLNREKEKLEMYKLQMDNLKTLAEFNEAMQKIFEATTDLNMGSAPVQFDESQKAIETRHLVEVAQAKLGENLTDKLESQLDQLTLDDEIMRRLAAYN